MLDTVKLHRVAPVEEERHDGTAKLSSLLDKAWSPERVLYLTLDEAGAEPCGEGDHRQIALQRLVHPLYRGARLSAVLIDRYEDIGERLEIQQEIVDDVADIRVIVTSYEVSQTDPVQPPQWVIADKEGARVCGQMLRPDERQVNAKLLDQGIHKVNPLEMSVAP